MLNIPKFIPVLVGSALVHGAVGFVVLHQRHSGGGGGNRGGLGGKGPSVMMVTYGCSGQPTTDTPRYLGGGEGFLVEAPDRAARNETAWTRADDADVRDDVRPLNDSPRTMALPTPVPRRQASPSRSSRLRSRSPVSHDSRPTIAPAAFPRGGGDATVGSLAGKSRDRGEHAGGEGLDGNGRDGTGVGASGGAGPGERGVQGPIPLHSPYPPYPPRARMLHREGRVVLKALVSSDGMVQDVEIVKGSGFEELDDASRRTLRVWRFEPGRRNGQPASAEVTIPIVFQLGR